MGRPQVKLKPIEDAAIHCFARKGVSGTTIRDIALVAGAAEGTLYRYYESKEVMALQLYLGHLGSFMERLEAAADSQEGTRRRIRAMIDCFYTFFEETPDLYTFLLLTEHRMATELPDDFPTPSALLVRVINEEVERGGVRRDVDPVLGAAMVLGTVQRIALFKVYGRISADLRTLVDKATDMCWRALIPA